MYPVTPPTITRMIVTAQQDDLARALRDARRGRAPLRRHILRRLHTDAR